VNRWAGPAFLVLLAATAPLLLPHAWTDAGWAPDAAVLAVVCLGFRGTPDRAALTGILAGALASLWSPEPAAFRPFVLGTVGWSAGQLAVIFDRDRFTVRMAAAAGGVVLTRVAEWTCAAIACRGGTPWTSSDAGTAIGSVVAGAASAALCAPLWFAAVRRFGLLAPLERSFRDV
jgi:hypothetical protein